MNEYTVHHIQTEQGLQDAYLVRQQVFVQEQNVPEELELDEHESSSEHFVVYDQQQTPIGAGRLRPLSNTEAKVERICVLAGYRGHGIGQLIMNKIEQTASEQGLQTLILNAQQHAEEFYERLGYHTVSAPFEEAGIIHVKMKKDLLKS